MSLLGKWVVHDIVVFGSNGVENKPVEKIRGTSEEEMYEEILNMAVVISPTSVDTYMMIPEDQIEEAKAAGAPVTEHGILVQSSEVKEENGAYFYDSGNEGEVMGEEIPRFVRLQLDEDGFLPFGGGMFRLKKAE